MGLALKGLKNKKIILNEIYVWCNMLYYQIFYWTPSYGGSYKITVVCRSFCLSVRQFVIFFRNGSIVFSDFWHDVRWLEYLKTGCSWYFTTNPIFAKIQVLELSAKILSANQIAGFFKMQYLKKEVNDEIYFWDADKHRSLVQVDTIIVGVCSQACPKYPK